MTIVDQPAVKAGTARGYHTLNPTTGELVATYETLTAEQLETALALGHAAYTEFGKTTLQERIQLASRFADLIEAHADELAHQITLEMGKPLRLSMGEVSTVPEMFRYYAANAEKFLADEVVPVAGFADTVVCREPLGVVLGIEPWNGPLYQSMRVAAPNLVLGNTVLLKPAEICAGSTLMLDKLFVEAGYPAGVFQTLLASTDQVATLIADTRVRAVALTGSDRAGQAVGELAGRNIKPVVLELGGSDPYIVLDSADVSKAAAVGAACRLALNGQICISPKRMIVTDVVADQFIEELVAAVASHTVGDPFDPTSAIGPMASEIARSTLQAQYDDAIAKGATVLHPGGSTDGAGFFFQPAVVTDINPDMRIYHEEAFGPLVMVYRVPDADAAVRLANSSPYGLGGTVFAEDKVEAQRVASQLDTGAVGINGWLGAPIEIPFGGTKRSGLGRELGRTGMDVFANIKTYGIAD